MLPFHFGLWNYSAEVLYFGGLISIVLSLFWRPIVGLYYLIPILPLQTIRYRMNDMPLGSSMLTLVVLAVVLGLFRKRQSVFIGTPWSALLLLYCGYLLVSFCIGSFYLGLRVAIDFSDPRFDDFRSYMLMPLLLFCTAGAVRTPRQIGICVILLSLGIFAVDRGVAGTFWNRDYSVYEDSMRETGVLGHAGPNGLGAFTAQSAAFAMAFAAVQRQRVIRLLYWALAGFSVFCLMYSFSRAGYLAFFAACAFIGIRKQPLLLVLLVVFGLAWSLVLPGVIQDRVGATSGGLDHSSETRVTLWEDALAVAGANLLLGTGFETYAYMGRVGDYRDTHNVFVKVLVENGVVGLALFLWLLSRTCFTGLRLFRDTNNELFASLGLALSAWVVCSTVANLFGDRWTYVQVNGYMWVMCGLVSRALTIDQNRRDAEEYDHDDDSSPVLVAGFENARTA